jgi:hypothetical protein
MILSLVANPFTLKVDPDDVNLNQQGESTEIAITGYHPRSSQDGAQLPYQNFTYILPRAEKAKGVKVLSIKTLEFAGEYTLEPEGFDPESYEPGEILPPAPLAIEAAGYQNGASMTTVSFCPVIYEPKTGRVTIITDITFEIETQAASPAGHPKISWYRDYDEYIELLRGTVQNPKDVDIHAPCWETVNSTSLSQSLLCSGYHMISSAIIIVPEDFVDEEGPFGAAAAMAKDSLNEFIHWERCSGRPIAWLTYEDIYEGYEGDPVEAVRDFLRAAHYLVDDVWGYAGIWTAILVGDGTTSAPIAKLYPLNATPLADYIVSDYYFASIEGTSSDEHWDEDGDGRLGEADAGEGDPYFDLYIGRVPASEPQHLINWVEKQIYYENDATEATQMNLSQLTFCRDVTTPLLTDAEYRTALPIRHPVHNPGGYMELIETGNCEASESVNKHNDGFSFYSIMGPESPNVAERTQSMITRSDLGYKVFSTGHSHGDAVSSLQWMDNNQKYSVAYPLNPYSCNFEDPLSVGAGYLSLNRRFDNNEVIGSPVCIGATGPVDLGTEYKKGQNLQKEFFRHIFQDVNPGPFVISPHSTGWGHYKAKEYYWDRARQECYSYNFFGAPWTCPWLGKAGASDFDQLVVHDIPPVFQVGHGYTMYVKDGNGNPVEGAFLTVYQPQQWPYGDEEPWLGGWVETYNSMPDGYARVYIDPDFVDPGGEPIRVVAVKYRSWVYDWQTERPVQYIPSERDSSPVAPFLASPDVEEDNSGLPTELSLTLEKHNLGNESCLIRFGNPSHQHLKLSLYDVTGRQVLLVRDEILVAGWYEHTLDLSKQGLANGAYFIKLTTGAKSLTEKLLLVR